MTVTFCRKKVDAHNHNDNVRDEFLTEYLLRW